MSGEDGATALRRLLKDHKKNLEFSKLSLWKLKNDLSTLTTQLTTVERNLEDEELNYATAIRRKKSRSQELQGIAQAFTKEHANALIAIATPTAMALDLATVVTQLCGCASASWAKLIVRAI